MNRQTKQRVKILDLLKGIDSHPTADQIYDKVRKDIPNISKGTVYRNLKVLQEMGLISELSLAGARSRFELKQKDHYHFLCNRCGLVFDLDIPINKTLDEQVRGKTGFVVLHHQIEFQGYCRTCQNKDY